MLFQQTATFFWVVEDVLQSQPNSWVGTFCNDMLDAKITQPLCLVFLPRNLNTAGTALLDLSSIYTFLDVHISRTQSSSCDELFVDHTDMLIVIIIHVVLFSVPVSFSKVL